MKKIFIGKKEKEFIKLIGLGVLVSASFIVPTLPSIVEPFIKDKARRANTRKILKRLEEKNVIYLSGDKIQLTERGIDLLKNIEADDIEIKVPKTWDGVWRIIAYDIPDYKKKERDHFRLKLKQLGFMKIQESLFVFPYECKEEISILAQSLGLAIFVMYLITDKVPNQKEYLTKYGLV